MTHTVVGHLHIIKIRNDDFLVSKNRIVRIWTPKSYNPHAKVPYNVIYMFDGSNLFDEATSFVGEWHIDETISECEKSKHIRPSIVVGIDSSSDRMSEYLPRFSNIAISEFAYKGDTTFKYLIDQVIPYVEANYNVGKNRKYRSIGGSSMGGLMALEGGIEYGDIFSKVYAFSPAFTVFKYGANEEPPVKYGLGNNNAISYVLKELLKPSNINRIKLCFSSGGGEGFEGECFKNTKKMVKTLADGGWSQDNLRNFVDYNLEHNEYQWSLAFADCYPFMDAKKKKN